MKRLVGNSREGSVAARRASRAATSTLECVVAFTLLSSVLACSTPLIVKHNRLMASQRDYRLALDEVTNQLERLTALPNGEVSKAVEQLMQSEFAATRLPDATLRGEVRSAEMGQQVTLTLSWEQPTAAPIVLTAWIMPDRAPAAAAERSPLP